MNEPSRREAPSASVQTVERAFDLLDALAAAGGRATLTDLAARTSLPLPTALRLLRTMQVRGYLLREKGRTYTFGMRHMVTGAHAARHLRDRLTPRLRELAATTGESVEVCTLDHSSVLCIAHENSPHSAQGTSPEGRRFDAHSTAAGKVLLSTLAEDHVLDLVAASGLPRRTSETVTEPATLVSELADIRRRGYARSRNEEEIGTWCVAVTIPGLMTSAALSVTGPAGRMAVLDESFIISLLHSTAMRISDELSDR